MSWSEELRVRQGIRESEELEESKEAQKRLKRGSKEAQKEKEKETLIMESGSWSQRVSKLENLGVR